MTNRASGQGPYPKSPNEKQSSPSSRLEKVYLQLTLLYPEFTSSRRTDKYDPPLWLNPAKISELTSPLEYWQFEHKEFGKIRLYLCDFLHPSFGSHLIGTFHGVWDRGGICLRQKFDLDMTDSFEKIETLLQPPGRILSYALSLYPIPNIGEQEGEDFIILDNLLFVPLTLKRTTSESERKSLLEQSDVSNQLSVNGIVAIVNSSNKNSYYRSRSIRHVIPISGGYFPLRYGIASNAENISIRGSYAASGLKSGCGHLIVSSQDAVFAGGALAKDSKREVYGSTWLRFPACVCCR